MKREAELVLIEKAKQNHRHFGPLYHHYHEQIFRYVFSKVGDMDIAGDVTSVTFMKAMSKIHTYEDRGFPFSSWLYRIASNEVVMHFRRTKRNAEIPIQENQVKGIMMEIEEEDHRDSKLKTLLNALNNMAEDQKNLIEWRFFDQMSFKEIGGILDIKEDAAKRRVYRTLEKLKAIMKGGEK